MMKHKLRRALLSSMPVVFLGILFEIFWFQLQIMHALAIIYLFLDYVLVAIVLALATLAIAARRAGFALFILSISTVAVILVPGTMNQISNRGPAQGQQLRVATFNWLIDERDRTEIYDWIKAGALDILALQEVDINEPDVERNLYSLFPYHSKPFEDVLILSRFPIVRQNTWTIVDRGMVRVEIDIKGTVLTLWNVHPSTLKSQSEFAARNHYLSALAEKLDQEHGPLLVMGDFNASRWDPEFRGILRHGSLHEQPAILAPPTRMGVRSGLPQIGAAIDHILINAEGILSDCQTAQPLGSDHRPLSCTLVLKK